MAKAQVKVKVKPGPSKDGGTVLVRQQVVIIKANAQTKPYGKPLYQTRAQLNLHIERGNRPAKTQLRRFN